MIKGEHHAVRSESLQRVFFNGLLTGLILQLAVGPVFFFVAGTAMQKPAAAGYAAVLGVAAADYLYIALALIGAGKLLERRKIKRSLAILSSLVLVLFGAFMIYTARGGSVPYPDDAGISGGAASSLAAGFLLTMSSPLTIVFWTGMFAARSIEYNLGGKELWAFGLSAGSATILFLGAAVMILSSARAMAPGTVILVLNIAVGLILILYGVWRLMKLPEKGAGELTIIAL